MSEEIKIKEESKKPKEEKIKFSHYLNLVGKLDDRKLFALKKLKINTSGLKTLKEWNNYLKNYNLI